MTVYNHYSFKIIRTRVKNTLLIPRGILCTRPGNVPAKLEMYTAINSAKFGSLIRTSANLTKRTTEHDQLTVKTVESTG